MGEFAVPALGRSSAAELLAYQGKVGTEHAEQPARRRYRVRGAAARAWFRERGYIASAAEQDALAGRAADALSGVLNATIDLLLAENEIAADSPRSPERI